MGVIVEAGVVREGTPICVPTKEVSWAFVLFFIISYLSLLLIIRNLNGNI